MTKAQDELLAAAKQVRDYFNISYNASIILKRAIDAVEKEQAEIHNGMSLNRIRDIVSGDDI